MTDIKLSEFAKQHFVSREKCAKALGVSYQHFNNMVARDTKVAELKNGDWITVHKYSKLIKEVRNDCKQKA